MNLKFSLNQKRNLLVVTGFNVPVPGWLMGNTLLDNQILTQYSLIFQNIYYELKGYHVENKSYVASTGRRITIKLISNADFENVKDIVQKKFERVFKH